MTPAESNQRIIPGLSKLKLSRRVTLKYESTELILIKFKIPQNDYKVFMLIKKIPGTV
jgi:hypothetical protein